jgi:hypothetical protein
LEYQNLVDDYPYHPSHLVYQLLCKVNEELDGNGVEGILDRDRGIDIQYVNVGDPYAKTVLHNGHCFDVGNWGDLIEQRG